jgi:hypothetical protein
LKMRIHVLFYGYSLWIALLGQMKSGPVKGTEHFIWIFILLDKAFKYGDSAKFRGYVATNAEPTLHRILQFCAVSCLCKLFNSLSNAIGKIGRFVFYELV